MLRLSDDSVICVKRCDGTDVYDDNMKCIKLIECPGKINLDEGTCV